MANYAAQNSDATRDADKLTKSKYGPGVLAGVEWCKEEPVQLDEEEKRAIKMLVEKAAKRDYPARLIEVIQSWEKLDLETPLATPNGWKTVGDIQAGDYVFGSNGRIISVLAIQPISKEKSYRLIFDNGDSIVASADHTWNTQTTKERYAGKSAVERSTKELFETQGKSHSIDLPPGLQMFDAHLTLDPYLLGCWLGDGSAANAYITGNKEDLNQSVQYFREAGFKVADPVKDGGKNGLVKNRYKAWIQGLSGKLRELGLVDNKHIPKVYLRASTEQRIALLQGLMDTDGWADGSGGCGWGQSPDRHQRLLDDVSELLASLGVKHQFYPYSRERDGKIFRFTQTTFRTSFYAFRLKRKIASQKLPKENGRTRKVYIQRVEEVGDRLVRCISVDADDHLFLAGKSMIPTHNCALFYRGFQFLIPQRQGGWIIPGESTGYGPSMQLDLALLPTNIYSTYAQILISALTRSVPPTRFEPQSANNDADITAAESADKFVKVIERNNDLIMTQTDAARYLFTDGRAIYWNRFVKDGQRFGWEQDDQPNDIVPETAMDSTPVAAEGQDQTGGGQEGPSAESAPPEQEMVQAQEVMPPDTEEQSQPEEPKERTPRGQEVRTAHGKLDFKLIPMMANDIPECHAVQFETEVDSSTAKGMFPDVADEIKEGTNGLDEGEIARLARLNVKLGMQSTYITSDSIADDVTIQRTWMRRSYFMHAKEGVRDRLIAKFPDGCKVIYAGTTFCCAYNESMDDSLALIQAFSGDGQNRNALGTSLMPVQKRLNNWLDLMNDFFVRCVPKKWMHNKAFDVEAIRQQTNIPGDIGAVKPQAGFTDIRSLIFVEEAVQAPASLAEFCKEYSGPLAELVTGAYPALSGGDTGANDTARGIAIQRDQALGRLGPTWHSIKNAEATSMKQLVRWGAKCRDNSINEKIPGGETIMLEVNNLQGNIMCFPESDENIPESYTQKQNRLVQFMQDSAKNPMLAEALYNAANLEFLQRMVALTDLYLPTVASRKKQLGEIEVLLQSAPIPNPQIQEAVEKIAAMKAQGVPPEELLQAEMAAEQLATKTPEVSSVPIKEWNDDKTELETCWQVMTSPEGRKLERTKPEGFNNLVLHWKEHTAALQAKNAGAGQPGKPPSESIGLKDVPTASGKSQLLAKGGIQVPPEAIEADEQQKQIAAAAAKPEPKGPMVQ